MQPQGNEMSSKNQLGSVAGYCWITCDTRFLGSCSRGGAGSINHGVVGIQVTISGRRRQYCWKCQLLVGSRELECQDTKIQWERNSFLEHPSTIVRPGPIDKQVSKTICYACQRCWHTSAYHSPHPPTCTKHLARKHLAPSWQRPPGRGH